jgi:hypothetical protein
MVDFGLACSYRDSSTYQHILRNQDSHLVGTLRFCSLNAHHGITLTRRDDLESIAYILIYFLRGSLPWQRSKTKSACGRVKTQFSIDKLCDNLPSAFPPFLNYARTLGFAESPNYQLIHGFFEDLFLQEGCQENPVFDWRNLNIKQDDYVTLPSMHRINGGAQNIQVSTLKEGNKSFYKTRYEYSCLDSIYNDLANVYFSNYRLRPRVICHICKQYTTTGLGTPLHTTQSKFSVCNKCVVYC